MARQYLAARGIDQVTARRFRLGWAPDAWASLARKLAGAGLLAEGELLGLIRPRLSGRGHYDVLRGRIVFPLHHGGRVVAFAGRTASDAVQPRYLNTRESPLFRKSHFLYGLHLAQDDVRQTRSALLVEGYFDVLALHQAGFCRAVGLCSASITAAQLAALQGAGAERLALLFDGDAAGLRAVERAAPRLLSSALAASVASLPKGEDPDTFLRTAGPRSLEELLQRAVPLRHQILTSALPDGPLASFEAKMVALPPLLAMASHLPPAALANFLSALATYSGLPVSDLRAALPRNTTGLQHRLP